jgi:hypothetical protein
MGSKYNFYDIVKIASSKPNLKKVNGKLGVIRGKSQHEINPSLFAYAVNVLSHTGLAKENYFIFEEDLVSTGKKADPTSFETGESVNVRMNCKTSMGNITDSDST